MDSLGRSLDKAHLLSHAKRSTLSCQFSGCLRHGGQLRSKFGRDISGRHPPSRDQKMLMAPQAGSPARPPASQASQPAKKTARTLPARLLLNTFANMSPRRGCVSCR